MGTGKWVWQGQPAADPSMWEKQQPKKEHKGTKKLRAVKDTKASKTNVYLVEESKKKKRGEYTPGRGGWQHKLSDTQDRMERYSRERQGARRKVEKSSEWASVWCGVVQRENFLNTVTKGQNNVRTGAQAGVISALPETK